MTTLLSSNFSWIHENTRLIPLYEQPLITFFFSSLLFLIVKNFLIPFALLFNYHYLKFAALIVRIKFYINSYIASQLISHTFLESFIIPSLTNKQTKKLLFFFLKDHSSHAKRYGSSSNKDNRGTKRNLLDFQQLKYFTREWQRLYYANQTSTEIIN